MPRAKTDRELLLEVLARLDRIEDRLDELVDVETIEIVDDEPEPDAPAN